MTVYLLIEWNKATRETRVVHIFKNRDKAEKMQNQYQKNKDFEVYYIDEWKVD